MKRLLFFICTLLCANVLMAQTRFWIGDIQYEVTSTNPPEVEVNGASESITTANIPATVTHYNTTYNVTSIGNGAFANCSSLTSITIPNSVTSIGDGAFSWCSSLTSVTIPNSVTSIGGSAFLFCSSLTSVTIGNSVTSIGIAAFQLCSSLTSVTIPNSVTSIGSIAFAYCSSLTSVILPNNANISSFAFVSTGGINVDGISYGGKETVNIGNYTFNNVGFITFYLDGNATTITPSEVSVIDCDESLSGDIVISSTLSYQGINYSVTSIGDAAFERCSSLTSITIPNSVTTIGTWAFSGCSSLTSVTIPNSVTYIGVQAFENCSSLTSVTIPSSVTSIGNSAFWNCRSLTSVTLPENATIGDNAFSNVGTRVIIDSVTYSGPYASLMVGFNTFNVGFTTFYVGDNVYRNPVVDAMVGGCDTNKIEVVILSSIEINDMEYPVTSIGEYAFENCNSLTSVTIPNSVTSVDACAFYNCSSLTSVTIPNSVTSIGGGVFSGCSSLTSVTLSNNITELPCYDRYGNYYGFFENCSSLTSITIPNNITSIGNRAFYGCSSLTSVDIPNSVTSIGDSAFSYCSSLTSLSIDWTSVPNIFSNIGLKSALQNLTFGENVASIASGAFSSYYFLQNVTCLATNPPTLEDNTVFPYPNIATLTVPCGTLEAYSSPTSFWNMFFNGRISEDCNNEGGDSGLNDVEYSELSFYPNPTDSKITFSSTIESIEVIDLMGRCVLRFANASEINIETLPSGAYYLRLTNNDKAIMRKVIKE